MTESVRGTRAFSCLLFELGEEIIAISDSHPLFLSLSSTFMKTNFSLHIVCITKVVMVEVIEST